MDTTIEIPLRKVFMWPSSILRPKATFLILCALFFIPTTGFSETVINPGETTSLGAETSNEVTDGRPFYCSSETNALLSENKAQALVQMTQTTAGQCYAQTSIYSDFTISDSTGNSSSLGATLSYDVGWSGAWTLVGIFPGYNDAEVLLQFYITDLTENRVLKTEMIHELKPDGFASLDILDTGVGLDKGTLANSIEFVVQPGHTYRTQLRIRCQGRGLLNSFISMDYMSLPGSGVWWNDLAVRVDADLSQEITSLKEIIDSLTARIKSLEEEVKTLAENLRTLEYTNRKGDEEEGHNKNEADTRKANK